MNWEEIATEERPVTLLECAILARFGGAVPKGEWWCWDFESFDTAALCFDQLKPEKYLHSGLRISLRNQPMAAVWTMQVCDATKTGMVYSQVFREFPTLEKLKVVDPVNLFSRIVFDEKFEKQFLIPACIGIQKYRETKPAEKSVHCPFMVGAEFLKPGSPLLLCILSYQEIK